MAITIGTNMQSMAAQKNVGRTDARLFDPMNRVSSGSRINSAKDDAAGLVISTSLDTQIRGSKFAIRNANDGISLVNTAESGMQEITEILQKMRELSIQAGNDTYSDAARQSLQTELDKLYDEIDRIAESAQFNEVKLLDGTRDNLGFQVGPNAGEIIYVELAKASTKALGLGSSGGLESARVTGETVEGGAISINGHVLDSASNAGGKDGISAKDKAEWINSFKAFTEVRADAWNEVKGEAPLEDGITGLKINGQEVEGNTLSELVEDIKSKGIDGGVTAILNTDGSIILKNNTGEDIKIEYSEASGVTPENSGLKEGTNHGYLSLSSIDKDNKDPINLGAAKGKEAELNKVGFEGSMASGRVIGSNVVDKVDSKAGGKLTINGVSVGETEAGATASQKAQAINEIQDQTGVVASAKTRVVYAASDLNFDKVIQREDDFTINGVAVDLRGVENAEQAAEKINEKKPTEVTATVRDGALILESSAGLDIKVAVADGAQSPFTTMEGTETKAIFDINPEKLAAWNGIRTGQADEQQAGKNARIAELDKALLAKNAEIEGLGGVIAEDGTITAGDTVVTGESGITVAEVDGKATEDVAAEQKLVDALTPLVNDRNTIVADKATAEEATVEVTWNAGDHKYIGVKVGDGDVKYVDLSQATNEDGVVAAFNALDNIDATLDGKGRLVITPDGDEEGAVVTITVNGKAPEGIIGGFFGTDFAKAGDMTFEKNATGIEGNEARGKIMLRSLGGGTINVQGNNIGLTEFGLTASVMDWEDHSERSQSPGGGHGAGLDIRTLEAAGVTIETIDAALINLGIARNQMGATQKRFESVIRNLENVRMSISEAKMRVEDADYAEEMSEMSKQLVKQQAGMSMVAQANAIQGNVLTLLQ